MAYSDANIIIGTSVDVGGISTGLHNIEKSFRRLGRLATLALGVKMLYNFGKAALDAASDLQEVQNVVDTAFGDMTYKMEAFAETAIEMYKARVKELNDDPLITKEEYESYVSEVQKDNESLYLEYK